MEAVRGATVDVCELRTELHDAVRALILDGLREHWGTIDPALNRDLDDLSVAYVDGATLVACHCGDVVGTGTVRRREGNVAEIVRMSVAPAFRRTGLGRRLTQALLETARGWGIDRVVLETSADWTEVVEFYTRCGFTMTHYEEGDFGRDAWFEMKLAVR
jgi:GNAT superfamily N-acetyltransferase